MQVLQMAQNITKSIQTISKRFQEIFCERYLKGFLKSCIEYFSNAVTMFYKSISNFSKNHAVFNIFQKVYTKYFVNDREKVS